MAGTGKGKIEKFSNKIHLPHWLTILLAIVLVLRIPSFFEPYSYGDEMIYLTLGEGIRQGIPLYKGIHDNKPPLLYITAAIAGSLFWFKVILAAVNLVSIVLFWKLSKALFPQKPKLHKVSTAIFAILTTIPLFEGNIANAELFMIAPTIAGFLILLKFSKKLSTKKLLSAGILFSTATLYKVPAAFDLGAIVFLWLTMAGLKAQKLKRVIKKTSILLLGFLLPIVLTLVWYFMRGALSDYIDAAFLKNVGYLSSWRPGDLRKPFLARNGPLLIRASLVSFGLAILYWKRERLSKQFIFIVAWLLVGLFAATLSERPYPHYLVQIIPALSLLLGILITQKTFEQSLAVIPLALAFFVPVYFKFWYYPTASYYLRFVKFAMGRITQEEYINTFGENVKRNYNLAKFIAATTEKKDRVFIWGDSAAIYALSRRLPPIRYVADYHINDFSSKEEVLEVLVQTPPKQIVILPNTPPFPQLTPFLRKNYILVANIDGTDIWVRKPPEVVEGLRYKLF